MFLWITKEKSGRLHLTKYRVHDPHVLGRTQITGILDAKALTKSSQNTGGEPVSEGIPHKKCLGKVMKGKEGRGTVLE